MYVKQGSRLVYACTFPNRVLTSPGEYISRIASDLANNHNIIIESSASNVSLLHNSVDYTFNLLVNDTDYSSEQDVRSIVDHYFYTEGGELPESSRIVSVRSPSGSTADTGAPPASADPSTPDDSPSWWDNFWTTLEAGGTGVLFGAAIVIGFVVIFTVKEAVE